MDVRCEKCGTEYELDEARLKPGGVTVKCTNCGHMFKIRKRTITSAGIPAVSSPSAAISDRTLAPSGRAPTSSDDPMKQTVTGDESSSGIERQWLIRLENGDQKSCRELATLQQWIVAGVVTRESLISRSGKTWKRLGDVAELTQYFDIGDEARTTRDPRSTSRQQAAKAAAAGTLLGMGGAAGVAAHDDEIEARTTGEFTSQAVAAAVATHAPAATKVTLSPAARAPTPPPPVPVRASTGTSGPTRRSTTQPPPPPAARSGSGVPKLSGPPPDGRSTATWANDPIKADIDQSGASGPTGGTFGGISTEPAFAGRVRVGPSDEPSFKGGRVAAFDDDDPVLPPQRGSRGGLWLVLATVLLGGAAAAAVYVFVIAKDSAPVATTSKLDPALAVTPLDDATTMVAALDGGAGESPASTLLDTARAELAGDDDDRLGTALQAVAGSPTKDEPPALALRAVIGTQLAQGLTDRAALVGDKAEAEALRKDARALVIDAATLAQKAHKATADDPAANVAMAAVLRLQGKPAKDVKRYTDTAKARARGTDWERDAALAEALVLARDNKLDEAMAAFTAIDQGPGALETSNDVRARFQLARLAHVQGKTADARTLADQILALRPEHAATRALIAKLDTAVATSDPLPPEENGGIMAPDPTPTVKPDARVKPKDPPVETGGGGGSYDQLVAKANALAERNCSAALEQYQRALDQKPNGVEALTGAGYCHIDAKQFASAFSKFRTALAASPRYEPALWGIAEAYQQQGRKDDAIEAYRKYLAAYPTSQKARRQLERLGVTDDAGGDATPKPGPAPEEPQPAPEPGGGTGSPAPSVE